MFLPVLLVKSVKKSIYEVPLRSRNTFCMQVDVSKQELLVVFKKMLPENFTSKKLYSEHKVAHFSVLYGKKKRISSKNKQIACSIEYLPVPSIDSRGSPCMQFQGCRNQGDQGAIVPLQNIFILIETKIFFTI